MFELNDRILWNGYIYIYSYKMLGMVMMIMVRKAEVKREEDGIKGKRKKERLVLLSKSSNFLKNSEN